METLDLHGIRHKEALLAIRNFLAKNQAKGSFSVTLITGNSTVLQQRLLKEI